MSIRQILKLTTFLQLNEMKMEVDIVMNNFLTQEDFEKTTTKTLMNILTEIKDSEIELDRWTSQEQKLNR